MNPGDRVAGSRPRSGGRPREGTLTLTSAADAGTTLRVVLPVPDNRSG
jgi:hypothetical protein